MSCPSLGQATYQDGNTVNGYLRKKTKNQILCCGPPGGVPVQGNQKNCLPCGPRQSIQQPFTQPASTYIEQVTLQCNGDVIPGRTSQARARELLAMAGSRKQFEVPSVRTERLIQETIACATNSLSPEARFSQYNGPPQIIQCPPLPPPPAPPLRACPLPQYARYG